MASFRACEEPALERLQVVSNVKKDIQTLNEWAREGKLECTAISVHAYAYVHDKYAILTHGASMGDGYGPMVVSRKPIAAGELVEKRIAIPGELTSAFLALSLFIGEPFDYLVIPFDRIQDAVHSGEVEAGLIIHERQLTHKAEGLRTIVDLRAWWKADNGLPR